MPTLWRAFALAAGAGIALTSVPAAAVPVTACDTVGAAPCRPAPALRALKSATDTGRARAVVVSDGYAARLAIHRYGSYAMLPLFAAQYVLGDRLIEQKEDLYTGGRTVPVSDGLRRAHVATAIGVASLFGVNTVTGLWNLREARGAADGRARRTAHVLLMLASDAGFVATGLVGRQASDRGVDEARRHRAVALSAMSLATAGALLMWIRGD